MQLYNSALLQLLHQRDPQSVAIFKQGEPILIRDLITQSQKLAIGLQQAGMRSGDRVMIAAVPGSEFLIAVYALMMTGALLAIIDPEMGRENYQAKLAQYKPAWSFIDYRLLLLQENSLLRWLYLKLKKQGIFIPENAQTRIIATGKKLPLFRKTLTFSKLTESRIKDINWELIKDHNDFLLTYTSGTVKVPNGVLQSYSALFTSVNHIIRILGDPKNQRIVTQLPHHMLIGVSAGIPVYLWNVKWDVKKKIKFIEKHSITTIFGPPAEFMDFIRLYEKEGFTMPDCLQHIMLGSAPVHIAFLKRLKKCMPNVRLSSIYGMTENLVVTLVDGNEKIAFEGSGDLLGKAVAGVELKIAEDGEILLHSDQLFSRYWHLSDRPYWHASGDLGILDNTGNLILTGRKKDMIIRRSTNIYPGLYEPVIKKIPGIDEAVLIGIYDESIHDERIYLVVESNENIKESALMRELQKGKWAIHKEAWPDRIIFLKIPRKGRQSKIDRESLRRFIQKKYFTASSMSS